MPSNFKGIIFDMDGTLIDSLWLWKQVDVDYLSRRNIPVPNDLHKTIEALSFTETALYFKNRFNLSESIDEIKNEWFDMVRDYYSTKIYIKDGVKNFLYNLKENKYKLGIATSNFRDLTLSVLERNEVLEFFDTIVTTCEVERDKSFPDVFLETAKRLDLEPSECIVFEDTLLCMNGAKKAGMKVVGVFDKYGTSSYEELSRKADVMIDDYKGLKIDWLKNSL